MPLLQAHTLLFDMDGTLVDSTALVESTWAAFSGRHALDLAEVLAFAHGRPTRETVHRFVADAPLAASETRRLVAHEESETTGITAVPGAAALLAALPPGSWAVVTSASRRLAEVRLGAAGLPVPELLVSADDVTRGKPDPQGYLLAAQRLGRKPQETVVFEDSPAGIRAALASGAHTVVIGACSDHDHEAQRYPDFQGFAVAPADPSRPGVTLTVPEPVAGGRPVQR